MTIRGAVLVKNGDRLEAARHLLRRLLDEKIVSAILVPMEGARDSVMPALVKNPALLAHSNPFAPVMGFNSARLVSALTREETGEKLGAVLRSCEIRALLELVKFNQARLDKLILVGVDCLGTFTVPEYAIAHKQSPDLATRLFAGAEQGKADSFAFRSACVICERPTASNADISIGFIGIENEQALVVEMRDDLAEQLGMQPDSSHNAARDQVLADLVAARTAARDAALDQFRTQMKNNGGMASYLADCLECTNCMNACPICYCKECFFRTANAEHAPRDLLRAAERQGAIAMPPDATLFHLARLNHMATSCVGCGMCEAACPHHIPLTAMFRAVGMRVQKTFNYVPGADVNEKPPFMLFQQNEFLEIGESKEKS